jgi:hypothetical protein
MKFESSQILERPMEEVGDAAEQIESLAPSIPEARQEVLDLMSRAKACIRRFPMAAVWTAFAGGFVIGAALARRQPQTMQEMYVTEPLRRSRKLLSAMLAAAADAGRDRVALARSAVQMPDMASLRRDATKLARKARL